MSGGPVYLKEHEEMKRKSIGSGMSMCVQPAFIIGTNNGDGSSNFAPITWVSVTCEGGNDYLLVISMYGDKITKQNVIRTGLLSANLVSEDILPLMDYFGTRSAKDGKKDGAAYSESRGKTLDVPVLDESPWVYECEVKQSVETGASTTFFCRIRNIQINETLQVPDPFHVDLTKLNPVVYSGMYHSIGKLLGQIGDFAPSVRRP